MIYEGSESLENSKICLFLDKAFLLIHEKFTI